MTTSGPQTPANESSVGTVLGIVALVCGVLGLIPSFGVLLAIVGLILGWIARRKSKAASNSTGSVLGLVAMVLSSITLTIAMIILIVAGSIFGVFSGGSKPLERYYGVWLCEGANMYEFRQAYVEVNRRRFESYTAREREGRVEVDMMVGAVTIDPAGGKVAINRRKCDKMRA